MARDTNTQEGARADIRIKGYLGSFQNTYFDVHVGHVGSKVGNRAKLALLGSKSSRAGIAWMPSKAGFV